MNQRETTRLLTDSLIAMGHPAAERERKTTERNASPCGSGAHSPHFCEDGSCYCVRCYQEL